MQDRLIEKKTSLNFKGKLEDINVPKIMGILNLTPDSFYDGGSNSTSDTAIKNVKKMLHDGAHYIDVGGYSSRPGASAVGLQEEIDRVSPIIQSLTQEFPGIHISIDTFRSQVADSALANGACMINDISGGDLDPEIWNVAAHHCVPYIAMHMKGKPSNMQNQPCYTNVVDEILLHLSEKISHIKKVGVKDIIIDPGFGFGKTIDHNYEIMRNLGAFTLLECPILVGISRKSMIYNLLESTPEDALNGTTVLNTLALSKGADILRVHDVKQAVETLKIWSKVNLPFSK